MIRFIDLVSPVLAKPLEGWYGGLTADVLLPLDYIADAGEPEQSMFPAWTTQREAWAFTLPLTSIETEPTL